MSTHLATVGPMSFGEHIAWFFFLTLVLCLVYDGLRAETVPVAVVRGLKRWVMFATGTAVLGGAFHFLVRAL